MTDRTIPSFLLTRDEVNEVETPRRPRAAVQPAAASSHTASHASLAPHASPPPHSPSHPPSLSPIAAATPFIVDLWRLVLRELHWLMIPAAVGAAAALAIGLQMAPVYRATATLFFEQAPQGAAPAENGYGGLAALVAQGGGQTAQTEFLQTAEVARRVIRKLDLMTRPEFIAPTGLFATVRPEALYDLPRGDPETEAGLEARALARFRDRLRIEWTTAQPQIAKVSFESPDPALAAAVVNELAAAYIRADMDAKYEATREANAWLTGRLAELQRSLETSERALSDYRIRNGLLAAPAAAAGGRDLSELGQRLADARVRRAAAEEAYAQASNADIEVALASPAIAATPAAARARDAENALEKRLSELQARYGAAHPQIQSLQQELQAARANVRRQVQIATRTLANELAAARASEKSLEASLGSARSIAQAIDRKETGLSPLEREVAGNRQLYQTFLARLNEVSSTSGFQQPAARLIDPAMVPAEPFKPRLALILVLGAALGALTGLAAVLLKDRLRNTLRKTDDIESRLGETLLAAVPKLAGSQAAQAARMQAVRPESLFAESIRTLATGVTLAGLEKDTGVIAISSALDGEGKTTVACNLALALAGSRSVLLIDADLRRPAVSYGLGLSSTAPGLSQLLAGRAKLRDCLQPLPDTELTVIGAGRIPGNALDLLMGPRFGRLIESLRGHFDTIIIDCPPVQLVSDTLVLGRVASGVILVARSDATAIPPIRRTLRRLRGAQIPLFGVVLNAHDFAKADRYYGEHSGYRKYGYRETYGEDARRAQDRADRAAGWLGSREGREPAEARDPAQPRESNGLPEPREPGEALAGDEVAGAESSDRLVAAGQLPAQGRSASHPA